MVPEGHQEVALARTRRSHQTEVLRRPDPLQAGQVVEGRSLDRRGGDIELLECLGDGERGGLHPGPCVREIP